MIRNGGVIIAFEDQEGSGETEYMEWLPIVNAVKVAQTTAGSNGVFTLTLPTALSADSTTNLFTTITPSGGAESPRISELTLTVTEQLTPCLLYTSPSPRD